MLYKGCLQQPEKTHNEKTHNKKTHHKSNMYNYTVPVTGLVCTAKEWSSLPAVKSHNCCLCVCMCVCMCVCVCVCVHGRVYHMHHDP